IPLATALSLKSGLPFVIVRKVKKGHGTKKLVEGRISTGDEVLLIEDVVTTGEQAIRAVETLKQAGARVKKVLCVIDREEGGRENIESKGLVFEPLFTKRSLGI
ncbi:MAG TPA: orotate phosphoribosyltransferase, partial [Candidatus Hypogeohydataceae bacterium YC38]